MTEKSTFRVKPGTDLFVGKTAPQGPYNGGAIQYFIANPEESLELIK